MSGPRSDQRHRGPGRPGLLRLPHRAPADTRLLAAIFCGGFIGAVARAELEFHIHSAAGAWPWTTFAVNIVGAGLLGYFTTRLQETLPVSAYRRPFLGTGICGGLTTFSTMQVELVRLLDGGRFWLAVGYAAASISAGLLAIAVTSKLVRSMGPSW